MHLMLLIELTCSNSRKHWGDKCNPRQIDRYKVSVQRDHHQCGARSGSLQLLCIVCNTHSCSPVAALWSYLWSLFQELDNVQFEVMK